MPVSFFINSYIFETRWQYYLVSVQENKTITHFLFKILRPGCDNHRGDHEYFVYQLVKEKLELIKGVCVEKYRQNEQEEPAVNVIGVFEDWDNSLEKYECRFEEIQIEVQFTGDVYRYPYIIINQVDADAEEPIQNYTAIFISEKDVDTSAIKHYNLRRINTHMASDYW